MYFSLFQNYLHVEKGGALYLNKLESPSPKDAFCQVDWNCLSGNGEEVENRISLDGRTDSGGRRTTDDRRSEKLTWAVSSGELNNYGNIPK